jgi:AcrR family transcriptional regulator
MSPTLTRPRIEGDREQEILAAALDVLADVGYDRLTMDAVAARARASKATLYRRWSGKVELVVDAVRASKGSPRELVDTGNLRDDLVANFCGLGGLTDPDQLAQFSSVLTAITRDEEFARVFRTEVLLPKIQATSAIYHRAVERGEIGPDVDLEVIAPALAGVLLHRYFLLGEMPTTDAVTRVIDTLILPALGTRPPAR